MNMTTFYTRFADEFGETLGTGNAWTEAKVLSLANDCTRHICQDTSVEYDFCWLKYRYPLVYTTLAAGHTAGGASITVASYSGLYDHQFLYLPSTYERTRINDGSIDATVILDTSYLLANNYDSGAVVLSPEMQVPSGFMKMQKLSFERWASGVQYVGEIEQDPKLQAVAGDYWPDSTGPPERYYLDNGRIVIDPLPDYQYYLNWDYYGIPTAMSSGTDSPPQAEEFHELHLFYALWKANLAEVNQGADSRFQLAAYYMSQFKEMHQKMRAHYQSRQRKRPRLKLKMW